MQQQGVQQAKSLRARQAICKATVQLLAEVGYAETSLNRVAATAGFSKGALQHHFPTKEDLISATVDTLLERTFKPLPEKSRPRDIEQALMNAWNRFINTPPYIALLEVLVAARTDQDLKKRLSSDLVEWGRKMDQQTRDIYQAESGDNDETVMLWNMTRSFMRGLLIQERYGVTREQTTQYVQKWIELVAPLMSLKQEITDE